MKFLFGSSERYDHIHAQAIKTRDPPTPLTTTPRSTSSEPPTRIGFNSMVVVVLQHTMFQQQLLVWINHMNHTT